jgi:heme/copper-type cytochrome/quinol oxidase subunit 1
MMRQASEAYLHNTYLIVEHFHYVLSFGVVVGFVGGLIHSFAKYASSSTLAVRLRASGGWPRVPTRLPTGAQKS